jgi:signal transduction histidine kinase
VASLLDVGRLSAGRLQLQRGEVDLGTLTREVLERLADVFERASERRVRVATPPAAQRRRLQTV